jgi:hypothetical protein
MKIKILILTANPRNTAPLRLSEEVRDIKAAWERSPLRDQFAIIVEEAIHPRELRCTMLQHKPDIVHFSGHGDGKNGLALLGENEAAHLIKPETLVRFFKALRDMFQISCVVLNACYSEVQAKGIAPYVDYVVGMRYAIGDNAARQFAIGFYDTLFAGETIASAFALGCNAIELENIPEHLTPVLVDRESLAATPLATGQTTLESSVPLGSRFYLERPPVEQNCYAAIQKRAGLLRIKAPRKMGKTSLLSRILAEGQRLGYRTAQINVWDRRFLRDIDTFLENFCAILSDELEVEDRIDQVWKKRLGSQKNCGNYLQKYLLKTITVPIVVALDEVDRIFQYPVVAEDFFALLRSWHELGKNDPVWQNLRLVICHSQEVYIPLNINRSPFNVGLPIELGEFSRAQVQELGDRHGLNGSEVEMDRLIKLVGGASLFAAPGPICPGQRAPDLGATLPNGPNGGGVIWGPPLPSFTVAGGKSSVKASYAKTGP